MDKDIPECAVVRISDLQELSRLRQEEEVTLIGLWNVLVKQWKIVLGVMLLVIVAGVVYAMTRPTLFEYSAMYRIGMVQKPAGRSWKPDLIERAPTVQTKIERQFLPAALERFSAQFPDRLIPKIRLEVPRGLDELLIIEMLALNDQKDSFEHIVSEMLAIIQEDQRDLLERSRSEIERHIEKVQLELDTLGNQSSTKTVYIQINEDVKAMLNKKKKIQRAIDLQKQRLALLEKDIAGSEENLADLDKREQKLRELKRELLNGKTDNTEKVLISTVLEGDLAALREKRLLVKQNLDVGYQYHKVNLEHELVELDDALGRVETELGDAEVNRKVIAEDLSQAIGLKSLELEAMKASLAEVRATELVGEVYRSAGPVGKGKRVMLIMVSVIALSFGIFAAFVVEFIGRARSAGRDAET